MAEYIAFATIQDADNRSRAMWSEILGRPKNVEDVTEYLLPRRERTGDPEADVDLPDGVDVAIVVHERDSYLDRLLRQDKMTAEEMEVLVSLYPVWAVGVDYVAGNLRHHNSILYRCITGHRSQSDWSPPVVPALWTPTVPAGTIPIWKQPLGGHDAYAKGSYVTHNGQVWASTIDANVWAPGTGTLWKLIG